LGGSKEAFTELILLTLIGFNYICFKSVSLVGNNLLRLTEDTLAFRAYCWNREEINS
jgi:hypothetical protein